MKKIVVTSEKKIKELDGRLKNIEEKLKNLSEFQELLLEKRSKLFYDLDLPCKVKYELSEDGGLFSDTYRIFLEKGSLREELYSGTVPNRLPSKYRMLQIPEKYKQDFLMVWKMVYKEQQEKEEEKTKKWAQMFREKYEEKAYTISDFNKPYMKKFYKILAVALHPDSKDGDMEAMQYLNYLKKELDDK